MKRIYSSDGTKSAPAFIVIPATVVMLPFILGWAFCSAAARAGRYAYSDQPDYDGQSGDHK